MSSPFKLLDAYTAADRDQFFGREEEELALYDMVMRNRLVLVYGQSGTGKTSLVQCGLACRFDVTDWYPLTIRRQNDLNETLRQRLAQASGDTTTRPPATMLDDIYATYLRPAYLIFDQLEELFILGSPTEQDEFARTVRDILDAAVPCRILFIIREEYLAWLYGLERTVTTLFDRRLRVEPMSAKKVRTMLDGSFRRFNIQAESPQDDTYTAITDNISGGRAGIQLPYLQVYLDMLYREVFSKKQPATPPSTAAEGGWPQLDLTRRDVAVLGKIENVLDRFLREQRSRIQADLKKQHPDIEDDAVQRVLDAFVSEEGTKRPVKFEARGKTLHPEPRWAELFRPLSPAALGDCCRMLEQARLLRFADEHAELAHDSLAALIDGQRSDQQRRLNEARNRLLSNFRDFRDTGEHLSRRQLNHLDDFLPLLEPGLAPEVRQFVRDSMAHVEATEQAELVVERRKRVQARRVAVGGLTLAALALVGLLVALQQYRAATAAKARIARAALAAQRESAQTLKVEGKYPEALAQLRGAEEQFSEALETAERQEINVTLAAWQQLGGLMASGDSLAALGDLRSALARYESARQLGPDTRIESLIGQTQRELEARYQRFMLNGRALFQAKQYDLAAKAFGEALKLKPEDAEAKAGVERAGGRR